MKSLTFNKPMRISKFCLTKLEGSNVINVKLYMLVIIPNYILENMQLGHYHVKLQSRVCKH